jgi:hypothetical protein
MTAYNSLKAYHYGIDFSNLVNWRVNQVDQFTYTFENFFHPFVGQLIAQLNQTSVAGMLDPGFLQNLVAQAAIPDFFTTDYTLLTGNSVAINHSPKSIDVATGGPYANYNWELLYHIPVMVAVHLTQTQRFAEAQKWFHLVFDPTSTDTSVPASQRFWKFIGFRPGNGVDTSIQNIGDLLVLLSTPDASLTPVQLQEKQSVITGYAAIQQEPFKPHLVARTRPAAYQFYVVMKYLDNLIAWGDSLFTQHTIETVNEATLCYVLASNLLGQKPQELPARGTAAAVTYKQLKSLGLDAMGNALVELEAQFPFNFAPPSSGSSGSGSLFGVGRTLYFCVPRNQTLLGYWDTIADRLFKIRHCMDIQGVVRPLALFDPPIDPGMLVKAAAAGIDIGSIVSGLNQPLGPVRSLVLIQKALEIASEVRSLGNALLSAIEKGDAEHLAVLRQGHEIKLQQLTQNVHFLQWRQAQEATQVLMRTRSTTLERYRYYLRLLGQTPDGDAAPDQFSIDERELNEDNWDDAYAALVTNYDRTLTIQTLPALKLAQSSSPSNQSGASGSGQMFLNSNEDSELNTNLPAARDARLVANIANSIAGGVTPIPSAEVHLAFWGMGAHSKLFSGQTLAGVAKLAADIANMTAAYESDQAGIASRTAALQRRADEWINQANLAARELMQIGRQILSSLISEQVASHQYTMSQTQVSQATEVNDFLANKFTNADFYGWMQGEVSRIYYQYYRFAFDVANRAEQTMKQELIRPELNSTDFVQFNYWDTGRQGLLSGDALYLDLKRMEMAYHDNNLREFELTRHVSLRQLDPLALLTLTATGSCIMTIPEWLYDRDCPGHYMRRIKSVSLSIPSVVGPYTSLNCTLSLQSSSVRISSQLQSGAYARDTVNQDPRFIDYFGAVDTVVTSGGTNDSGLFETNLKDDRFLPFEGSGAISTWNISLPTDFPAFDYSTISDVILHIRYTAREGGDLLGAEAVKELKKLVNKAGAAPFAQTLFLKLRYDFPTEWSAFVNGGAGFTFTLRKDYFPYAVQGAKLTIDTMTLYAYPANGGSLNSLVVYSQSGAFPQFANLSTDLNTTGSSKVTFAADPQVLTTTQAQVFLIVQYQFAA